jgi:hypothetical protein
MIIFILLDVGATDRAENNLELIRLIAGMLLHVALQLTSICCVVRADGALEGPFSSVLSHMLFQITSMCCVVRADGALEWLFTSVCRHVSFQITSLCCVVRADAA